MHVRSCRGEREPPLSPFTLLAPLAEAGAREPLPSSLAAWPENCQFPRARWNRAC